MQVVTPLGIEVDGSLVWFSLGAPLLECGEVVQLGHLRGIVTDVVTDSLSALVPTLVTLFASRDGPTVRHLLEAAYHRPVSMTDQLTVYVAIAAD